MLALAEGECMRAIRTCAAIVLAAALAVNGVTPVAAAAGETATVPAEQLRAGAVVTNKFDWMDVPIIAESDFDAHVKDFLSIRGRFDGAAVPKGATVYVKAINEGGYLGLDNGLDPAFRSTRLELYVNGTMVSDGFGTLRLSCAVLPVNTKTGPQMYAGEKPELVFDGKVHTVGIYGENLRVSRPLKLERDLVISADITHVSSKFYKVETGYFVDEALFKDISLATPHFNEISWLVSSGVTTGFDDGTFKPYASVARCDMAAFLYRLAGSPEFVPTELDRRAFKDVNDDTYHAKEVWWLASTGISKGWTEKDGTKTFRPLENVTRQDMAAFLHRLSMLMDGSTANASAASYAGFIDVTPQTAHAEHIAWLANSKVSEGWLMPDGAREFRGLQDVKRADMAAFLQRMDEHFLLG